MTNALLTDETLQGLIGRVRLDEESKSSLKSRLPELDKEERTALLIALAEVCLLDLEEKGAIERIKKFWQA